MISSENLSFLLGVLVFCGETIIPKGTRGSQLSFKFTIRNNNLGGKKMKKLTASIVAGALMISAMGINAFAANGTPEIKVYGNGSNPVKAGETASFIVRLSDFAVVKGMDITITSKNNKVEFTDAQMDKAMLTKDSNVKVEKNKIHIVDLTSADMQTAGYANITVEAKVNGADTINVEATLAKDGKSTVKADYKFDDLAVKPNEKTAVAGKLSETKGYFIPYGFIETSDKKYVDKAADGSFEVPAEQTYAEFEVPANGITTFGYGHHNTNTAVQFGTYTNKAADKRGTLLFEGDWEAFKNYYITQKGYTVEDILNKVYTQYETKHNADNTVTAIKIPAGENISIVVRRVEQTKSMWVVKSKDLLQYAARLTNISDTATYSGVGYSVVGDTVTFSEKVITAAPVRS